MPAVCSACKRDQAQQQTVEAGCPGKLLFLSSVMLARPLHPRTPPRPDPQVPGDRNLGLLSSQDPAFGFCDIEVSIHHGARGKVRFELYCVADGYQTARGVGAT